MKRAVRKSRSTTGAAPAPRPAPTCPYCGADAVLETGATLYPHRPDLADERAWVCTPCDARVGCHRGTTTPKGRLANASLRRAKMAAHRAFDPLWQSGKMGRREAYAWLAERLGIPAAECHIGLFDEAQCAAVVAACEGAARP